MHGTLSHFDATRQSYGICGRAEPHSHVSLSGATATAHVGTGLDREVSRATAYGNVVRAEDDPAADDPHHPRSPAVNG